MLCPSGIVAEVVPGVTNASNVSVYPTGVAISPVVVGTALGCPLGLLIVVPGTIWPIPVW